MRAHTPAHQQARIPNRLAPSISNRSAIRLNNAEMSGLCIVIAQQSTGATYLHCDRSKPICSEQTESGLPSLQLIRINELQRLIQHIYYVVPRQIGEVRH